MLGWIPDTPDHRDFMAPAPHPSVAVPARVNMAPGFPSAYNQRSLGSCTAWSTLACAQYTAIEKSGDADQLAALFQYYNARRLQGTVDEDSGASIRNAIKALARWGSVKEPLYPYVIKNFKKEPPNAVYAAAAKRALGTIHYARVAKSHNALKAELAAGNPIVFGFEVKESFMRIGKSGNVPMPTPSESTEGGHAVVLVGYDDARGCYIVRNSWGADWGDHGYCYMPYRFIDLYASDFWTIRAVPY